MKAIKSYFTLKYASTLFTDVVSGKKVCLYIDCYGEQWMKDGRWAFFRVKHGEGQRIE
jgi:spore germination protein YaaH